MNHTTPKPHITPDDTPDIVYDLLNVSNKLFQAMPYIEHLSYSKSTKSKGFFSSPTSKAYWKIVSVARDYRYQLEEEV